MQRIIYRGIIAWILITVFSVPAMSAAQRPQVVRQVLTQQKVVALTYDDGPDPRFTPALLGQLDKYGIKATFFMIGQRMEMYPGLVQEVLRRGHVIGNHTYTHPQNYQMGLPSEAAWEISVGVQTIERASRKPVTLFRPPRGFLTAPVLTLAEQNSLTTVLWSVSADNHLAKTPQQMADRVLKMVQPGGIILAHDGTFASRWKDVSATPLIIEGLTKRGYRFVTVPELLEIGRHERLMAQKKLSTKEQHNNTAKQSNLSAAISEQPLLGTHKRDGQSSTSHSTSKDLLTKRPVIRPKKV
ncbi:MAG: polysaccharide deacetylase family protein [Armatimonadota bacterium]|nr:polysaccharide deacetylase family protein [bacterium]